MNLKFALAATAACLTLSACNTSNGSSGALTSAEAQNVEATSTDYQARISSGALTTTTPTGKASMSGYMGVSGINPDDSTTTAMGKLAMDVDFDAGTVSGTASNFGIYSGETLTKDSDVSGSLGVTGTVSGSDLQATATGTMSDGSGPAAEIDVNLSGKFYDDAGTLTTVGDVSGTMTESGDTRNISGNYYATEK